MTDPRIQQAIDAIGEESDDDYKIAPTSHADQLGDGAQRLAAMLRTPTVETIGKEYERNDALAVEAQNSFRRESNRANVTVAIAGMLSAGVLVVATFSTDLNSGVSTSLFVTLGVLGVVVGAAGAMFLSHINRGDLLTRWMGNRAQAEMHRAEYFETVTSVVPGDSQADEIPIELLQLEYFRRYQLDVEESYYRNRQSDHRASGDRTVRIGSVAVFVSALGTGLAGVLATIDPRFAAIATLALFGTVLSGFATYRESISQDRRNAERYDRTHQALVALRLHLGQVRERSLAGDRGSMEAYVRAVNNVISAEHRQWLAGDELIRSAIADLERSLERTLDD